LSENFSQLFKREFWHLHRYVCLPHHSLEKSRTFQELALKLPGLSRAWKFYTKKSRTFQNFPGGEGTVIYIVPKSKSTNESGSNTALEPIRGGWDWQMLKETESNWHISATSVQ